MKPTINKWWPVALIALPVVCMLAWFCFHVVVWLLPAALWVVMGALIQFVVMALWIRRAPAKPAEWWVFGCITPLTAYVVMGLVNFNTPTVVALGLLTVWGAKTLGNSVEAYKPAIGPQRRFE